MSASSARVLAEEIVPNISNESPSVSGVYVFRGHTITAFEIANESGFQFSNKNNEGDIDWKAIPRKSLVA